MPLYLQICISQDPSKHIFYTSKGKQAVQWYMMMYQVTAFSSLYYPYVQEGFNLAVMHIGAPACGMNAAVRSFVRNCIYRGDTALGIHDGIEGLLAGNVSVIIFIFCSVIPLYRAFPHIVNIFNEFSHLVEFECISQLLYIKSSSEPFQFICHKRYYKIRISVLFLCNLQTLIVSEVKGKILCGLN